jgi:hypothetical protein
MKILPKKKRDLICKNKALLSSNLMKMTTIMASVCDRIFKKYLMNVQKMSIKCLK